MRWLSIDPGESVGWALWEDGKLLDSGTGVLWSFADSVYRAVLMDPDEVELFDDELAALFVGVEMLVVEDFRIYPWEARKGSLDWDQVRTARLIGSLQSTARWGHLTFHLQPAKIKESAIAAGASELFLAPLHECRHGNDAIMHGVYWWSVNKRGMKEVVTNDSGR